uniref:tumor necrosis factor receptor superfamily member 18 n=1 Tax=Scatophagus argus TaxID=75038 RepID=UPI001ED7FD42|nr:tumor necrosis factor receptor superfamily member 18 [Scatophagus argus]
MSPLRLCLAVTCALNIWTTEYTAGCGDHQAKVNGHCCDLCPPGKYMKEFCSQHQPTVCSPCQDGYYSNQYNIFDRCEKCQSCQQEYAGKCTTTTNTNCSCHSGFLCTNNVCSKCVKNKCTTGERLMMTANSSGKGLIEYSYQCEPLCLDNAYFDIKEGVCKPRTQCSILGLAERFPGNKTHNSVCDGGRHGNGDFVHVILGIGFVLLSLTLLVLLSYACIKKLMKHRSYDNRIDIASVCTNASDFHLSKEESGHQLIIQDESKNSNSLDELHLEKVSTS